MVQQRLTQAGIGAVSQRTIRTGMGVSGARYAYVRASDLQRARDVLGLDAPLPRPTTAAKLNCATPPE